MKLHSAVIVKTDATDPMGQWYWRALARNGRELGWTGEQHISRAHCLKALIAVVAPFMRGIPVYEVSADGKTKKRIDEHGKPFFS